LEKEGNRDFNYIRGKALLQKKGSAPIFLLLGKYREITFEPGGERRTNIKGKEEAGGAKGSRVVLFSQLYQRKKNYLPAERAKEKV